VKETLLGLVAFVLDGVEPSRDRVLHRGRSKSGARPRLLLGRRSRARGCSPGRAGTGDPPETLVEWVGVDQSREPRAARPVPPLVLIPLGADRTTCHERCLRSHGSRRSRIEPGTGTIAAIRRPMPLLARPSPQPRVTSYVWIGLRTWGSGSSPFILG
jgi:hypothetical protein